jgi:hypothetical protein
MGFAASIARQASRTGEFAAGTVTWQVSSRALRRVRRLAGERKLVT